MNQNQLSHVCEIQFVFPFVFDEYLRQTRKHIYVVPGEGTLSFRDDLKQQMYYRSTFSAVNVMTLPAKITLYPQILVI